MKTNLPLLHVVRFSAWLVHEITSAVDILKSSEKASKKSITSRRLSMWKSFHSLVVSKKYKESWISLLNGLNIDVHTPIAIVSQHLAEVLLENVIVQKLRPHTEADSHYDKLSTDEEQAVRYSSGFIVRSLKKKFARLVLSDSSKYIEVLDKMYALEDCTSDNGEDFLQYTKEWLSQIDRGGLYKVTDETYLLFHWMELTTRKYLKGQKIEIDEALDEIICSENVMMCWSLICGGDMEEDESDKLLNKIAELWITVRGFSYAGNLFEQYKCAKKDSVKKKSLRKTLRFDATK